MRIRECNLSHYNHADGRRFSDQSAHRHIITDLLYVLVIRLAGTDNDLDLRIQIFHREGFWFGLQLLASEATIKVTLANHNQESTDKIIDKLKQQLAQKLTSDKAARVGINLFLDAFTVAVPTTLLPVPVDICRASDSSEAPFFVSDEYILITWFHKVHNIFTTNFIVKDSRNQTELQLQVPILEVA